jgi:hypothetical protein
MERTAAIPEPRYADDDMPEFRLDLPTAVALAVALSVLGWGAVAWAILKVFGRPI